jgi:hypothetical protein
LSLFEYLGVLISVVMGLGITHLLIGVSKTIHYRNSVRVYWVHSVWTVNVLVFIVVIWWGMFWWSSLGQWGFYQFLFVVLYAIILFLLASILYPWELARDFDFRKHFFRNHRWFFGIQALAWCVDVAETGLKAEAGLREPPQFYMLFVPSLLILSLIGAVTSNRRYHAFFSIYWLCAILVYLGFTTLARIAA